MITKTNLPPSTLAARLYQAAQSLRSKINARTEGDTKADEEIVHLIASADACVKQLFYSFLHTLEKDGRLNAANIDALKEIEKMDDDIRKHAKKGMKEEDYLRRVAAHFEALTEAKLQEAEKMAKHLDLAKRYAEMAKEHERIAKAEQNQ